MLFLSTHEGIIGANPHAATEGFLLLVFRQIGKNKSSLRKCKKDFRALYEFATAALGLNFAHLEASSGAPEEK